MNKLPHEILSRVFIIFSINHLAINAGNKDLEAYNAIEKLAHVSQLWRKIALETTPIWSTIDIAIRYPHRTDVNDNASRINQRRSIERRFSRSKDAPLSMGWGWGVDDPTASFSIVAHSIIGSLQRLMALYLKIDVFHEWSSRDLPPLPLVMPRLETLVLLRCGSCPHGERCVDKHNPTQSPLLSTPQLKRLDVEHPDYLRLVDITQIQTLKDLRVLEDNADARFNGGWTSADYLLVKEWIDTVSPQNFYLWHAFEEDAPWLRTSSGPLPVMSIPNVRKLSVIGTSGRTVHDIFVGPGSPPRMDALRSLEIEISRPAWGVLRRLPQITSLSLRIGSLGFSTRSRTTDIPHILHELSFSQDHPLCPHLRTLHFENIEETLDDDEEFPRGSAGDQPCTAWHLMWQLFANRIQPLQPGEEGHLTRLRCFSMLQEEDDVVEDFMTNDGMEAMKKDFGYRVLRRTVNEGTVFYVVDRQTPDPMVSEWGPELHPV